MNFKKIEFEYKETIEKYTSVSGEDCCEFTFYNLYLWQDIYGYRFAEENGILYIRVGFGGNYVYALPFGDTEKGICALQKECGDDFPKLWAQDGARLDEFKKLYGKHYTVTELRDEFDYIYLREDLQKLSGKKYHSKRNHISAFSSKYDWHYEAISEKNVADVRICAQKWYEQNLDRMDSEMQAERRGMAYLLGNFSKLGMLGGVIRVDGEVVAFTIGSAVNQTTVDVYIEKSLLNFAEGYAVINREFVSHLPDNFKYINREDDLGLEGLRKAKLSYHPCRFIKKYICQKRDIETIKKIYTDAFGESAEFDDMLFDCFSENIETYEQNGRTVSMLFLLPCFIENRKYYYIYAAATEKSSRNKGCMTALLKRVSDTADAPLFLVPSKDGLIPFYEKSGFKRAEAGFNSGDTKITVSKEQEQLSHLCDNCPDEFPIMFSDEPKYRKYLFKYAMP